MVTDRDIIKATQAKGPIKGDGVYYRGFSPRSAMGYDGEDQWADWEEAFKRTEWEATYRWVAQMRDGTIVDYCEGDVTTYPASENEGDMERLWTSVTSYLQ